MYVGQHRTLRVISPHANVSVQWKLEADFCHHSEMIIGFFPYSGTYISPEQFLVMYVWVHTKLNQYFNCVQLFVKDQI